MTSGDKVIDRVERGEYLRADVFDTKINAIEKVNRQLTTKIEVLSTRMNGLEARVTALRSMSWQFAAVVVIITLVGIVLGAVIAFAPSIWAFIKRIRHPELLQSEIKTLVREEINDALEKYFSHQTNNIGGK